MPTSTVSLPTETNLELLGAADALLYSAPRLLEQNSKYTLNRKTIQGHGSDIQGVSGDGRILVGEHTYYILVYGDMRVERKSILEALQSIEKLRYGLVTQDVAGGIGIESEVPWSAEAWKVGIIVAPSDSASTDGTTDGIGI